MNGTFLRWFASTGFQALVTVIGEIDTFERTMSGAIGASTDGSLMIDVSALGLVDRRSLGPLRGGALPAILQREHVRGRFRHSFRILILRQAGLEM